MSKQVTTDFSQNSRDELLLKKYHYLSCIARLTESLDFNKLALKKIEKAIKDKDEQNKAQTTLIDMIGV